MYARRRGVPPGGLAARFLFLYAFVRIFIDVFREYPLTLLGLPSGQTMNILMSVAGVALLWRNRRRPMARPVMPRTPESASGLWWRRALFAAVVLVSMVIASDATRDIPAKYGTRHPGLEYSRMYPPIPEPASEVTPRTRRTIGRGMSTDIPCAGPPVAARGLPFGVAQGRQPPGFVSSMLMAVSVSEVRRAIPLRRVRPVGRDHLSAGGARQQGEGGGLRQAAREGQRCRGVARRPAEHPRRRRSEGRGARHRRGAPFGRRHHLGLRRARDQDGPLAHPRRSRRTRVRVGIRDQRRRHHPRLRDRAGGLDIGGRRRGARAGAVRHGR